MSITPVARGVSRPVVAYLVGLALVGVASAHWALVHRFAAWLVLVLSLTVGLVALTRTARWRSHKVHVTSQRVVLEGGVLHHWTSSVRHDEITATHVDQRMTERLVRRGYVVVETASGTIPVGPVRHPAALARLIDAERHAEGESVPLDSVFTYTDETNRPEFEVRVAPSPRRRRDPRRDSGTVRG